MTGCSRLSRRVPITVKVPVVVALLMVAIGVVASERVLGRLVARRSGSSATSPTPISTDWRRP